MMRLGGRLLLFAVLLCLPLGCEPPNRDNPLPASQGGFTSGPCLDITEILPDGWHYATTYRMDTNYDDEQEWVILYHFDLPEGKTSDSPIGAVIYQLDDRRPPNITAYDLRPQDGDYLCECTCRPTMNDVLSGLEGDELVVRDYCDEKITRLTILRWDPDTETYLPKGHFCGHSITIDQNQVAVEQPLPGRAQLLMREIYHPCENNTSYQPGYQGTPEICEKRELVFAHGEPEDVMCSPYPEKVVLAFYKHYTEDENAPTYFTEEGWERVEQCNTGQCGCRSARSEITHVRVTELVPEQETYSIDKGLGPDRATVRVTVVCERRNDAPEDQRSMRWHLVREDDRWRLERPE
jgi:hypothetical protein